ncbi:MAG: hypothetical protein PHH26_05695 [Candidatus Thermoplasmatota archaeon]|nr:hypothetical protein [Candidatus Thermoplasmatota archaeon]
MASPDSFYWNLEVFLKICVLGISGIMLVPSILSYLRLKSVKLLFVSIAFVLFFIKGVLMVLGLFLTGLGYAEPMALLLLDIGVLFALYAAAAK